LKNTCCAKSVVCDNQGPARTQVRQLVFYCQLGRVSDMNLELMTKRTKLAPLALADVGVSALKIRPDSKQGINSFKQPGIIDLENKRLTT
jgi:hypothetical protein